MHHDNDFREWLGGDFTVWHLCWQAAVSREFFAEQNTYERIQQRLFKAHDQKGRVLVDYLLLPREMHVIAKLSAQDTPARVAQAIGNVVSRWVRAAQPIRSPVLAGPFHARRIASIEGLRNEVQALAWRPVRVGLCSTPTHSAYGGLRIAMGLKARGDFDARPLLTAFGSDVPTARDALRNRLKVKLSDPDWVAWELVNGLALASGELATFPTGSRWVRRATAAALIGAGGPSGIDGALNLLEVWVKVKLGIASSLDLRELASGVGTRARALVACLAVEHELCSAASVARHFGRAKATLCEQMAACRKRPEDRKIIGTPGSRILEEATAVAAASAGRNQS